MVENLCIVQARQTSTRLPNKVLQKIGNTNETVVEHIYIRLKQSKLITKIIFAIPDNKNNMKLRTFLNEKKIPYYCGDESDVLSRYYNCALKFRPKFIIRATCDNPFVDWELIDNLIVNNKNYDYSTCLNAPLGVSVEVFTFNSLEESYNNAFLSYDREHVTSYIYNNPTKFRISNVNYFFDPIYANFRLTLDTKQDLLFIDKIYNNFRNEYPIPNKKIYDFLIQNPEL